MLVDRLSTDIRLIDFGLAVKITDSKESVKVMCGTPEFVSPEVIGFDPVSAGTDMWSVGVITYVLLSGFSPFAGDNDHETYGNITRGKWDFDEDVFDDVSENAKDFISKLIVKDPRFVDIYLGKLINRYCSNSR